MGSRLAGRRGGGDGRRLSLKRTRLGLGCAPIEVFVPRLFKQLELAFEMGRYVIIET